MYDQYAPSFLGIITQILKDPELSCDCLQHCFNEIWNQKDLYDPKKERIFSWMLRIVRKSAVNFLENGHDYLAADSRSFVGRRADDESKAKVAGNASIPGSPPDVNPNEVLQLVYIEGFTFEEAAQRLQISTDAVKLQFVSAIKNLKTKV